MTDFRIYFLDKMQNPVELTEETVQSYTPEVKSVYQGLKTLEEERYEVVEVRVASGTLQKRPCNGSKQGHTTKI